MALLEMVYTSRLMNRDVQLRIIAPEGPAPENGWPVLYLLHGGGDDHTSWTRRSNIERYVEKRNLVVVMPDGGGGQMSFYMNRVHGGKYFTLIADELPRLLSNMLHVSTRREDTFIAGFSMGGYGAARFALMRPEQYGGAIIMSAGNMIDHLDVGPMLMLEIPEVLRMMQDSFGDDFPYQKGTDSDLIYLAQKILDEGKPAPKLFQTIGTEDPGYEQTRSMREFFTNLSPDPFCYRFTEHPGTHNWDFWDRYICEGLDYMGLTEQEAAADAWTLMNKDGVDNTR